MKIKNYLPALLAVLIFVTSCSENEPDDGIDNASAEINAIAGEMNQDVVTLVQSEGVNGALSLVDLMNNSLEFGRISPYQADENRAFIAQKIDFIDHYFTSGIAVTLGEEPAEFTDIKGVYAWDFTLQDFVKVEESDILVIAFPVDESTTNNGEFRLTEFTVVFIDGYEYPKTIKADLSIDDVEYINLDFAVSYSSIGDPESADIFLKVLPFALDVKFDDTQSTSSSLAVTMLLEGENLIGADATVTYTSTDKLEPVSVSGEVFYKNLRIVGSISDTEMDNSVEGNPNEYIDLDLFLGDQKAGDIVFELEEITEDGFTYEDYVPYVLYGDGTKEKLEDILLPVIEEIEDVFEDLD